MNVILNEKTAQDIEKYLANKSYGPLILFGDKGMGKGKVAEYIAGKILGIPEGGSLDLHPDFYSIYPDKGMIRVGQIERLHEWCAYVQVEAPKKVIVIYDAGLMNDNAQNALLKLLEDGNDNHTVILVSEHQMLDTIKSRCQTIVFHKLDTSQLEKALKSLNPEIDERVKQTACLLADGHVELLKSILSHDAFLKTMVSYMDCLSGFDKRREILEVIGGVREKDSSYLYDGLKDGESELRLFLKCNVTLFLNALYAKMGVNEPDSVTTHLMGKFNLQELTVIVDAFVEGVYKVEQKRFTRNDFFRIYQTVIGI